MGILEKLLERKERTVEEAQGEYDRLAAAERDLMSERETLQAKLAELQEKYGTVYLESKLSSDTKQVKAVNKELEETKAALQGVEKALGPAREAKQQAQKNLWLAQAAENRRQAAEKRKEADERQKKTDALLKQLKDFEGVDYMPAEPNTPRPDPNIQGGSVTVAIREIPRTQWLYREAQRLEKEAAELERKAHREAS